MFVNLIELASGMSIDDFLAEKGVEINENAFIDTTCRYVLAANALGIIRGVGGDRFDPDGTFRREQIAAIISRTARALGIDTAGYTHPFTDVHAEWLDIELGWPVNYGIIRGVSADRFDPSGPLSTEAAIAIAYRALPHLS